MHSLMMSYMCWCSSFNTVTLGLVFSVRSLFSLSHNTEMHFVFGAINIFDDLLSTESLACCSVNDMSALIFVSFRFIHFDLPLKDVVLKRSVENSLQPKIKSIEITNWLKICQNFEISFISFSYRCCSVAHTVEFLIFCGDTKGK